MEHPLCPASRSLSAGWPLAVNCLFRWRKGGIFEAWREGYSSEGATTCQGLNVLASLLQVIVDELGPQIHEKAGLSPSSRAHQVFHCCVL